jgi:hypothetical protein
VSASERRCRILKKAWGIATGCAVLEGVGRRTWAAVTHRRPYPRLYYGTKMSSYSPKRLIQTILHAPLCSQGTSGCPVPLSSRRVVRFGIHLALPQGLRRAIPATVTGSPSHATCDVTRAIQEGEHIYGRHTPRRPKALRRCALAPQGPVIPAPWPTLYKATGGAYVSASPGRFLDHRYSPHAIGVLRLVMCP